MASYLQRLGHLSASYARWAILAWVLVIAGVGAAAALFSNPLTDEFTIPDSRYQEVMDDLQEQVPEAAGTTGTVVFTSEGGFDDTDRSHVADLLEQWRQIDGVSDAVDPFEAHAELEQTARDLSGLEQGQEEPGAETEGLLELGARLAELTDGLQFVSEDGTTALGQVQFADDLGSLDPEVSREVRAQGEALDGTGVDVEYSQLIVQDVTTIVGLAEAIGLAVAAVVLFIMLRSLLAAGLPLLTALVGVGVGIGTALALTSLVEMNTVTPALALMLGLAVGIDYSLFLIHRHRTQLRAGMEMVDSIALATGTAGIAVVFAGITNFVALAALAVTAIPFLTVMGLVAAGTVLLAVLATITLTPAILAVMGPVVLPRKERPSLRNNRTAQAPAAPSQEDMRSWAARLQQHPWLTLLGGAALVAAAAIPATGLRLGLPDGSSEPEDSTAYQAYDLTRDTFGEGENGPIVALASFEDSIEDDETALLRAQVELGEDLADLGGSEYVLPFGTSEDRSALAFQIVPTGGPAAESTEVLVDTLQAEADSIGAEHDAELGFTGQTVANIDISQQLADALPLYLAVVVGLSLILLLVIFRSLVLPLLAAGGFLFSVVAAFGAVVAVYQWGWLGTLFDVHEPGPILSFLPILLIGVLFGLAIDYQLFLGSGMREAHSRGEPPQQAVRSGFNLNARVVVAAAIIMIAVFSGFVFAQLAMIRPIGFALAVGVLVDAFLVRMTLIPAALSLIGDKAWQLPGWLERLLPNVDVEGSRLDAVHRPGARPGPDEA